MLLAITAALALLLSPGCESDTENGDGSGDCTEVGETESCTCADGLQGSRTCLGDGTYTECYCSDEQPSTCRSPGAESACACPGGGVGIRYCLRDGSYSPCDCSTASAGSTAAGSGPAAGSSGGGSGGCPAGFSCMEIQGFQICVDSSGFPPSCSSEQDCTDKGLTDAMCTDPGGIGKVCLQLCG
jgi:hypothetical protein